jgi:hypothetical protein
MLPENSPDFPAVLMVTGTFSVWFDRAVFQFNGTASAR